LAIAKKRRHEHFCPCREASDATCVSQEAAAEKLFEGNLTRLKADYHHYGVEIYFNSYFIFSISFFSPMEFCRPIFPLCGKLVEVCFHRYLAGVPQGIL